MFAESFHPFVKTAQGKDFLVHEIDLGADPITDMVQEFYYGIEEELEIRSRKTEKDDSEVELAENLGKWVGTIERTLCQPCHWHLLVETHQL